MWQGMLAVVVVAIHFAFLGFVVFGGLLTLRWRHAPWLHLPAVAWGGYIEVSGRICPLTPLENQLRAAAGGETYPGGFIEYYMLAVLYPDGLTRSVQLGLALALVLFNVAVYGWIWRRRARRPEGS